MENRDNCLVIIKVLGRLLLSVMLIATGLGWFGSALNYHGYAFDLCVAMAIASIMLAGIILVIRGESDD